MNKKMEAAHRFLYERVKVLVEATNDHARLVAFAKLKDAVHAVEREERRRKRTLKKLAAMEE